VSAGGLDELRERLMPWIMAAVRLGAGWLLCQATLLALATPGSPLRALLGDVPGVIALLLTGVGLALFAWPRTCLAGAALLAAEIVGAAWLWRRAGLVPPPPLSALAVIGVLAGGEWLTRRVRRRLGRE